MRREIGNSGKAIGVLYRRSLMSRGRPRNLAFRPSDLSVVAQSPRVEEGLGRQYKLSEEYKSHALSNITRIDLPVFLSRTGTAGFPRRRSDLARNRDLRSVCVVSACVFDDQRKGRTPCGFGGRFLAT